MVLIDHARDVDFTFDSGDVHHRELVFRIGDLNDLARNA